MYKFASISSRTIPSSIYINMGIIFQSILKYKFTILFSIGLFFIIGLPVHFTGGVVLWLHIAPILLILYLIAKVNSYYILDMLFAFLICINAYFAIVFKSILNLGFLGSILETDAQEASGMLQEFTLPILLIAIVSFVLVFGAVKEMKTISFSTKIPLILLCLYSFVFLPYTCHRVLHSSGLTYFLDKNPVFVWQRLINTHAPIFYGNIAVFVSYGNEIYEFKKYMNMERVMPEGVAVVAEASVEKVYFILGESSWRKRYSLYGYNVKTTPFLDSLSQQDDSQLAAFNGIAPGAITRNAIPLIMTFATIHDFNLYYKQKSILDIANMQGYETIWISNQSKIDDDDAMGGSSISQIAASASEWHFSDVPFSDDFNLLEKLNRVKKDNKRQFIVFHLSGSHMSYHDKYDDIDAKAIVGEPSAELSFDRSIHHTDRFIAKIYEEMKQDKSSLILYLSDHGEIINLGHGLCIAKSEFEVPLLAINNSQVPFDSILNKYVDSSTSLLNTSNVVYALAEILGCSVDEAVQKQAIGNTTGVMYDQTKTLNYLDLAK